MPEKLITSIPLIARYSRHNEAVDWRFTTAIKCDSRSDAALDGIVQEITHDVWKQIDCTTCANCCKVLEVVVDDADIKRLAARLKISPRAFRQANVAIGKDKVKYLRRQPCVFLGPDNKCTVYEDRPAACQDFPYLHKNGFRQRTLNTISNLEICPIVFNVWQELKERLRMRPSRRRNS